MQLLTPLYGSFTDFLQTFQWIFHGLHVRENFARPVRAARGESAPPPRRLRGPQHENARLGALGAQRLRGWPEGKNRRNRAISSSWCHPPPPPAAPCAAHRTRARSRFNTRARSLQHARPLTRLLAQSRAHTHTHTVPAWGPCRRRRRRRRGAAPTPARRHIIYLYIIKYALYYVLCTM